MRISAAQSRRRIQHTLGYFVDSKAQKRMPWLVREKVGRVRVGGDHRCVRRYPSAERCRDLGVQICIDAAQ
eukprot:CAMPEP_0115876758 /NCGR_PEP_ID=MMETSP0287-20121206/25851_1 /TAXON_ID=412157 /ORGANISM="Chrysochromulina rotalis, Strain UIO044" /LENGTH=70 /DNA_ID=CAMNT_0003332209 /DNA_START=242 /DNA_END=451 /DNA_ORIENTATION=+